MLRWNVRGGRGGGGVTGGVLQGALWRGKLQGSVTLGVKKGCYCFGGDVQVEMRQLQSKWCRDVTKHDVTQGNCYA